MIEEIQKTEQVEVKTSKDLPSNVAEKPSRSENIEIQDDEEDDDGTDKIFVKAPSDKEDEEEAAAPKISTKISQKNSVVKNDEICEKKIAEKVDDFKIEETLPIAASVKDADLS